MRSPFSLLPSSESVPTVPLSGRHIYPGDEGPGKRNHRGLRGLCPELPVVSCARRLEIRSETAGSSHLQGDCRNTSDLSLLATPGEALALLEAVSTDGRCILSKKGGEAVLDCKQPPPSPNGSPVAGGEDLRACCPLSPRCGPCPRGLSLLPPLGLFLISWTSWATLVAFFQDESWL